MTHYLKKLAPVALVGILAVGCIPAVRGSGHVVNRTLEHRDFNRIEAGHAFKLKVTRSDEYGVSIDIDDNLLEFLRVSQEDDTLRIDMQGGRNYKAGKKSLVARIAMPELVSLDLSGASQAVVQGFVSHRPMKLEASGASSLEGELKADRLSLDISGASELELRGSAQSLALEASGASEADLAELKAQDASVYLSGASEATVHVVSSLDVTASGASDLTYLGNPTLGAMETSGAASIHHKSNPDF
jgi:hypothetical protein